MKLQHRLSATVMHVMHQVRNDDSCADLQGKNGLAHRNEFEALKAYADNTSSSLEKVGVTFKQLRAKVEVDVQDLC